MTKIIHPDQTTKQPVVWRCPNPECRDSSLDRYFDFESDQPKCPKCSAGPPVVSKRALIHLLVRDPQGKIVGEYQRRYKLACDASRSFIATQTNGEAGTDQVAAANCPGCLAEAHKYLRAEHHSIRLDK